MRSPSAKQFDSRRAVVGTSLTRQRLRGIDLSAWADTTALAACVEKFSAAAYHQARGRLDWVGERVQSLGMFAMESFDLA